MSDELRFDERAAIITGAGNGLGKAHALELARRGAMVVVNDLGGAVDGSGNDTSAAQAVVDEIKAAGGIAVANTGSVTDPAAAKRMTEQAIDEFGRLDIVVNNAGILRDKAFHNSDLENWQAVIDVHLTGAYNVTLPAYQHMREQGSGRIVMTSSPAGLYGNFGQTNYSSAKMGLVGFARAIKQEGGRKGVSANVIAPTADTRMTEGLLGTLADDTPPELITAVVGYLCHDSCELNGEVLACAGGRVARVFVGATPGIFDRNLTIDMVAENIEEICAEEGYTVPDNVGDEMGLILEGLKANPKD
ncbi:MAG: SDR family NAD(P)-dependent oxidoreductase [Acidimicrobiales bacterium]|jgi:NAD(P)-dependent dehydrogenase (short-subunit alcohol dehydrogenase family)|nr:SDR family NAD(P)-dependent oxidoreductase [Acidimicrobiales bacterium]